MYTFLSIITQMEELQRKLDGLERDYSRIDSERMKIELKLRDRECFLVNSIRAVKLELQKAQNENGSNVTLDEEDEKDLRHSLRVIQHILSGDNDESKIILSYETPIPNDKAYSVHVDLSTKWQKTSLTVTIKTKCAAVENMVRETISEYRNMAHTTVGLPEELCREWRNSYHNEYYIQFNHKAEET
jgi:hypothetical protein